MAGLSSYAGRSAGHPTRGVRHDPKLNSTPDYLMGTGHLGNPRFPRDHASGPVSPHKGEVRGSEAIGGSAQERVGLARPR